jgi:hypothetical protein
MREKPSRTRHQELRAARKSRISQGLHAGYVVDFLTRNRGGYGHQERAFTQG